MTQFTGEVVGTEKIDGTNVRIILLPDDSYLIGSREELLYAKGDLIGNPALRIVEAVKPLAETLSGRQGKAIIVVFVEVYGGKVTAASKQYTSSQQVSCRLFDVLEIEDFNPVLNASVQEIARWRDIGGQPFLSEDALKVASTKYGIPLVPRLFTLSAKLLPQTIDEAHAFLIEHLPESLSKLDVEAGGKPEGIVVRTVDRSLIAKMRLEDYERTLRRRR